MHVVRTVAVDATEASLVMHVGGSIVAIVSVVVLFEDVLVRIAAIESVVIDNRVVEPGVLVGRLESNRIGRVLNTANEVGILVEADAPVLEHRAV